MDSLINYCMELEHFRSNGKDPWNWSNSIPTLRILTIASLYVKL